MAVTAHATGTETPAIGTCTISNGAGTTPGIVTLNSHGLAAGDKVVFTTTGTLPTGLTVGTIYYVISGGLTSNAFEVATTDGGAAINTSSAGSGTHSLTSENFLTTVNVAGTFTFHVDTDNMVAGDSLELRIYQMILTGGTSKVTYYVRYDGLQVDDDLVKISVPISNELTDTNSLKFSLRQAAGTARAFPWKVLKYA